jgi:hypothetical protein
MMDFNRFFSRDDIKSSFPVFGKTLRLLTITNKLNACCKHVKPAAPMALLPKGRDTLEVFSKPQIRFKGKAQADRENGYVSIYRRPATRPLGFRWGFETTSNYIMCFCYRRSWYFRTA